jgi:hypothetical protein
MMRIMKITSCLILIMAFAAHLQAQFRIHSYGIDIANSVNGISVGYQDFESIGMKTNFITKGQPELSVFNPMIGISITTEYDPLFILGRISFDDRSGYIEDEIVPTSLSMQPHLSYLTFESALMIKPWNIFSVYGGPSLSFLLNQSIGTIGENGNTNQLTNMNSPIPGLFAGISADFQLNQLMNSLPLHISPFFETSLIFNQRTGEFPENQDGFDNIWSTFSLRTGISITLNPIKETPNAFIPFSLKIPSEMAGKRAMNEHFPLIMEWTINDFATKLNEAQSNPGLFNSTSNLLCSKSDVLFQSSDITKQRVCIQERSLYFLLNHLKQSTDTCIFTSCSDVKQNTIQKTMLGIFQRLLRIDTSRMRFIPCEQHHEHAEIMKATLVSGQIPIIEMDFVSVSPPENVIICTMQTPNLPKEWFIDISGPQKYKRTFGPFAASSVHLDGSELLQGEAGTGSYQWSVRFTDELGIRQEFNEAFNIRMSNENKMQGHSFTYLPDLQSYSKILGQIDMDLKQYLRSQDEILIIIDKSASEDIRKKAKDIQRYLINLLQKQNTVLRKYISIIEKGKENALYTSTSSWGKIYEQGIRLEIIH